MNLIDARKEIIALAEADCAIMLVSGSGMGKSEVVYQTFAYMRDRDAPKGIKWGMSVVFAATQTPQTIAGLQFKGQRDYGDGKTITISDPSLPLWMVSTGASRPGCMTGSSSSLMSMAKARLTLSVALPRCC